MEEKKWLKNGFGLALVVSILLHGFFLGWNLAGTSKKKSPSKKMKVVFVHKKKKQIVDSEKGGRKAKPLESRFLSEQNQIFQKETMARHTGAFQEAGRGVENGVQKPQPQSQKSRSKKISLADLAVKNNARSLYVPPKGAKKGSRERIGVARSSDYIEEIPLGDMTNLNSSEFKYYGFFARIKNQLEQYWGLTLREKVTNLQRTGRSPASATRMTSLRITLDKRGSIVNILVKGTSGIKELDNAAVESFNKAGPFPNPPSGMLKNGKIVFDFGLVSTING